MFDAEKIIIDLGSVKIDLSFDRGTCQTCVNISRAENFSQEEKSARETSQPVVKSSFALGAFNYNRADLEKYKSRRERVKVNVVGMFNLATDVSPALALEVVESVKVIGVFQAQSAVKDALLQAGKIS